MRSTNYREKLEAEWDRGRIVAGHIRRHARFSWRITEADASLSNPHWLSSPFVLVIFRTVDWLSGVASNHRRHIVHIHIFYYTLTLSLLWFSLCSRNSLIPSLHISAIPFLFLTREKSFRFASVIDDFRFSVFLPKISDVIVLCWKEYYKKKCWMINFLLHAVTITNMCEKLLKFLMINGKNKVKKKKIFRFATTWE